MVYKFKGDNEKERRKRIMINMSFVKRIFDMHNPGCIRYQHWTAWHISENTQFGRWLGNHLVFHTPAHRWLYLSPTQIQQFDLLPGQLLWGRNALPWHYDKRAWASVLSSKTKERFWMRSQNSSRPVLGSLAHRNPRPFLQAHNCSSKIIVWALSLRKRRYKS